MRALWAGSKRTRHDFSSSPSELRQQRANEPDQAVALNAASHVGSESPSARFPAVKLSANAVGALVAHACSRVGSLVG